MALNLRTKLELTKTDPGLVLSFQNTPDQPDEYLEQRLGRDYLEYLKMQRDCEIRRCMTRLINSTIGRSVVVSPASDSRADRKVAAFFQDLIGYERKGSPIRYERMNAALLRTGQIVGFSVLRIDWINDGELVLPRFEFVPQRRFIFCYPEPDRRDIPVATDENLDPETEIILVNGYELRLLTKRAPYTGERCPKNRFLVYTFDSESPWGMGLGYSTYPWWQVKREATTSLLMRSDLDGQPPAIGNHPANFKDDHPAVLQLERFLEGISPNNWARLPEGFSASIMDTIGKAGAEVQTSLITIANHEICKVILGEILYSEKASGSYAANISQVEDRESSLIDGYCNLLDEQLVEFWQQIHQYNRLPGDPAIVHRETRADERATELERSRQAAKKERVDLDKALADLGIRLKQSAIADIYGEEYIDTTALQDGEDKQALVVTLGVGGTQALISFLGSLQTLGMSRDNAIAALTGIFGVPADVADKIIPEAQPEEAAPPATLEDAIAGALGDQGGEPPQQFEERGIPQSWTVEEVLSRIFAVEYGEFDLAAVDFAAKKADGTRKLPKCKPENVRCGYSCKKAGTKCKSAPSPDGQQAMDLADKSITKAKGKTTKSTAKAPAGNTPVDQAGADAIAPSGSPDQPNIQPKKVVDLNSVIPNPGDTFKSINKSFELNDGNKGSLSFDARSLDNLVSTGVGGSNLSYGLIKAYSVDFKVNGTYDAGTVGDSKAGVKAALKIRKEMQAVFKNLPDGTIVHNEPYQDDGKGNQRAALYEKFGFGKPIKQSKFGKKTQDQYGMVIGGKVYPLDKKGLQSAINRAYQKQQSDLFDSLDDLLD